MFFIPTLSPIIREAEITSGQKHFMMYIFLYKNKRVVNVVYKTLIFGYFNVFHGTKTS